MPRSRTSRRRTPAEWARRGALALLLVVAAYASLTRTLASIVGGSDPARAHRLAPEDGRLTGLLARQWNLEGDRDRREVTRLAVAALRRDPTAVAAAATLGIVAGTRGDMAGVRRSFGYAEALSRRDLSTQLWGIEDAVARGDVAAALRHYDIALRTARTAPELLFPILSSAIADPAIRRELIRTLAQRPAWSDAFIYYVANEGPRPDATTALFLGAARHGVRISRESRASVIKLLVSRGQMAAAWSYYAATQPGADRRSSRDPKFLGDPTLATVFDWNPLDDAGVTASIQAGDAGGAFTFSVPSSIGGPLLRQAQLLPAGRYRLTGHSVDVDQPATSLPFWTLVCADGRQLGRVEVPSSAQNGGRFIGRFDVQANCPVQTLTFMARPSTATNGAQGQIDDVRLVPEG